MRSLSYKTLIWNSTWFKQNCSPTQKLRESLPRAASEPERLEHKAGKRPNSPKHKLFQWFKKTSA